MFRTKSLSCREMANFVDKSQTNTKMKKENKYGSLRSLIADKTMQYHRHMERLVLQENNLTLSSRKSTKKTPSNQKFMTDSDLNEKPSIQEFTPFDNSILDSIKENWKDSSVESKEKATKNTPEHSHSLRQREVVASSEKKTLSHKRSFSEKSNLENQLQILGAKNNELNERLESLCEELDSYKLTKIQKQSQVESLKITIKLLQLKIESQNEKEEQALKRREQFKIMNLQPLLFAPKKLESESVGVQAEPKIGESYCQTECTRREIEEVFTQYGKLSCEFQKMSEEVKSSERLYEEEKRNILQLFSQDEQSCLWSLNHCDMVEHLLKIEEERVEKEQIRKAQMKQKDEKKVKRLTDLLILAQNEIRMLLKKLRDQKEQSVQSFRTKLQEELAQTIMAHHLA